MNDMASTIIPNERWKPIPDFPEYAASNKGQIKRVVPDKKNHACRILKPWLNNKGYAMVCLCNNNGKHRKLVSRLVCLAFKGSPPSIKHEVAHYDGDPSNNASNNLRWATRAENMEDTRRHGTMAMGIRHGRTRSPEKTPRGESHGHAKLTERDVKNIRARKTMEGSGRALAVQYGVSQSTICMIRSRKTWRHI